MLPKHFVQVSAQFVGGLNIFGPQLNTARVLDQSTDIAKFLQLAFVKDSNSIANILHIVKTMAAHNDRLALLTKTEDKVLHPPSSERIEARSRLVQDDQLRI